MSELFSTGIRPKAEYRAWKALRWRCNPKSPTASRYFNRGIKVCERWNDFWCFYEDMGARPTPKHTLDRIDNDKGYEPGNCRWATYKEQANNTSHTNFVEYEGERIPLTYLHELTGIPVETLRSRVLRGITDNLTVKSLKKRGDYGRFV